LLNFSFKKFIPKIFHDDPKTDILADKVDTHLALWKKDVIDIKRIFRPDEVASKFLAELNYYLSAGFQYGDSDVIKRRKTRDAVATHKIRGTWTQDAKIRIDNITGLVPGARILKWNFFYTSDWIWVDSSPSIIPASPYDYWSTMGCDGVDDGYGLDLIGSGDEIEVAGNIYIDCHEGIDVATLTAAQRAKIVLDLTDDVVPAYFRVLLGYINAAGIFVAYDIIYQ